MIPRDPKGVLRRAGLMPEDEARALDAEAARLLLRVARPGVLYVVRCAVDERGKVRGELLEWREGLWGHQVTSGATVSDMACLLLMDLERRYARQPGEVFCEEELALRCEAEDLAEIAAAKAAEDKRREELSARRVIAWRDEPGDALGIRAYGEGGARRRRGASGGGS